MPVNFCVQQPAAPALAPVSLRQRMSAHLRITRLDHCVKQVFIFPGILLAMAQ